MNTIRRLLTEARSEIIGGLVVAAVLAVVSGLSTLYTTIVARPSVLGALAVLWLAYLGCVSYWIFQRRRSENLTHMTMSVKKPTVFISYSYADKQFVDDLANGLKASGVDVWIDKWMIRMGDSITEKINRGIGASDWLIVVLSSTSVRSRWVKEELNAATVKNIEEDKHAFILPILIEECEIPILLRHRYYVDFKYDPEHAFQELLEVFPPAPSAMGLIKMREKGKDKDTPRTRGSGEVDFTVFYPMTIFPERWFKLLAYMHLPSAFEFVLADSRTQFRTRAHNFATGRDRAALPIKHGAEIVIVPELPGCRFNPPRTGLLWLEDWHRAEFRIQAEPDLPGFELDMLTTGRVAFYVGPILIGEVQIAAYISRDARHTDRERPHAHETAKPYQSVFVSYSHKDTAIVDGLESAYMVLGMEYLRDVRILRSGEKWNPALLGKIEEADIFQLCWSYAAKASSYVEQEWRHALDLRRSYFIRPVYWEKPMPAPPSELSDIHFAYLELEHEGRAA